MSWLKHPEPEAKVNGGVGFPRNYPGGLRLNEGLVPMLC